MLGMDPELDEETGLYTKVAVRNMHTQDSHAIKIDPKISRYYYANHLWSMI